MTNTSNPQQTQPASVVIIGAGPAGLATAGALTMAHIPYVLLEQEDRIGSAWARHYDRLHLHTVKRFSSLPGLAFDAADPRYIPRLRFLAYLESYAKHFDIEAELGTRVTQVAPGASGWHVDTDHTRYQAQSVVVATGYNRRPRQPQWPGQPDFTGEILHSSGYHNGARWRDKRVLVVGTGNSGAEIALDLCEHGAKADISARSPVHVVPRELFGVPIQMMSIAMSQIPPKLAGGLAGKLLDWVVGDLSQYGLFRPTYSPITQVLEYGRIPLIDVGTVDRIKSGEIRVMPPIESFTPSGVAFKGGQEEPYHALVLATGYTASLADFVQGADELVNERGYPKATGGTAARPGLYFIGYGNPLTGALREINHEACRIADALKKTTLSPPGAC